MVNNTTIKITKEDIVLLRKKLCLKHLQVSTELVSEAVKLMGGNLASDFRYINSYEKFYIKCKSGHKWETKWNDIQQGHWCPVCSGRKIHEDDVRRYIEHRGGTLDKKWSYFNSRTKFDIICEKGHKFNTDYNHVLQGKWCASCWNDKKRNIRLKEEDIRKVIEDKGGTLSIGWAYTGATNKFNIICNKGHSFDTYWSNIQQNKWCPECSGQIVRSEKVISLIKGMGGKVDKEWRYHSKLEKFWIECKEGHKWETHWDSLRSGNWCPRCSGHVVYETDIREVVSDKGGFLDKNFKYEHRTQKFWVTCAKGHRWKTSWSILYNDAWCPHCSRGKSQQEFRELLENFFNRPFPSERPKWLRDPKTKRLLELDGYNEFLKIAFEYQGYQHYRIAHFDKFSKNSLKDRQRKDRLKKSICKKRGVLLLVVPYWTPKEQWISLIEKHIKYEEQ